MTTHPPCLACGGPMVRRDNEGSYEFKERQYCSRACGHAGTHKTSRHVRSRPRSTFEPEDNSYDAPVSGTPRLPVLRFLERRLPWESA